MPRAPIFPPLRETQHVPAARSQLASRDPRAPSGICAQGRPALEGCAASDQPDHAAAAL